MFTSGGQDKVDGLSFGRWNRARAILAVVLLALILLGKGTDWIEQWLWMAQFGFERVFVRLLLLRIALFVPSFAIVFLFIWFNFRFAVSGELRASGHQPAGTGRGNGPETVIEVPFGRQARTTRLAVMLPAFVVSLLLAMIFGLVFLNRWDTLVRFIWGGGFGSMDPIYGNDIGFYVFSLPFFELIQNSLLALFLLTIITTKLAYFVTGRLQATRAWLGDIERRVYLHLSALFILFLAAWAWGYYLDLFDLLFSQRGVVYGIGYTDYHVVRPAIWVMFGATIALGLLVVFSAVRSAARLVTAATGIYLVLMIVAVLIVPAVIQRFSVAPNELALEAPFLTNNITMTRRAYMLDRMEEKDYRVVSELTYEELSGKRDIIRNIRLWDWRPMLQTYKQTQAIRLYYDFYEIDVDRYMLDGESRQVMLSARELVQELPEQARTWVNTRLQYTHGYGLAMSFVSETAEQGLPVYVIENLPPASRYFSFTEAGIYYGENTPGFCIANTRIPEFDYPKGSDNVYTRYGGKGGVLLNSFWKKLLFAWQFMDINFLLSDYIAPESRVQFSRTVQERVLRIAPFLVLDNDPYLVTEGGRLYWIQDAYTASSRFPYSTPYGWLNYMRNPLKIVVDAYHGTVRFYVLDESEPVLRAYMNAFPELFLPFRSMPADLQRHIRYPEDLFSIQVEQYLRYHMTTPQVFYNQEDLWRVPSAKYAGETVKMAPYYILTRLPGEERLEYVLIVPVVPTNRENMIAWIAAKSDQPDYGNLIVYRLPKQYLTYGPMQIEANIDQDDFISQQLTLWDQRGSRVVRGNLIVIPVDSSFLYVEPVFIVAEGINIPQLKRVIMVYGKRVVMEPTIDGALEALFRGKERRVETAVPGKEELTPTVRKRIEDAQRALEEAMKALKGALSE